MASIVLYKLGGSLLDLPEWPRRLAAVLDSRRPDSLPLIVVGGGEAADIVRKWDTVHKLGEERSHQLALQAMALNEALAAELLPGARIVGSRDEAATAWRDGVVPVLAASRFLRDEEPDSDLPLPHTWEATSDSIAAWVAIHWPADELMLLKSTDEDRGSWIADRPGEAVDRHFAELAPLVPRVGWINLRAPMVIGE